MEYLNVLLEIAKFLRIPLQWLAWPGIISYLIVPFIFIWYAFYKLLEKIGIFKRVGFFNKVMATVFSLICLPFGNLAYFGAAGFIGIVILKEWKKRIAFFIGIVLLYFLILPLLAFVKP